MLHAASLILAAAALALFVNRSELLDPLRRRLPAVLDRGARCCLCASFWAAVLVVAVAGPGDVSVPLAVAATWGGAALLAVRFHALS